MAKIIKVIIVIVAIVVGYLGHNNALAERSFKLALPGYQYEFPKDLRAHEDYKTEWWYYTGHLKTENGKRYGYELTFFRVGNPSENLPDNKEWALNNLYMTHFAISDENNKRFFHTQKFNRSALDRAGADTKQYNVWNENWSAHWKNSNMVLKASTPEFGIDLILIPQKAPVIHGKNGISQKSNCQGCASHYFSYTRLKTTGTIKINDALETVNGVSWMDQEFGSNQLSDNQTGWDWFSIQLDNRVEVMLYLLRLKDGSLDPSSSGTFINANGQYEHLSLSDFKVMSKDQWKSPHSTGIYPMDWSISIPSKKLNLTVQPTFKAQELHTSQINNITYWEGSCNVSGTYNKKPIAGQGYVEMTGYAKKFKQKI